MQLWIKYKKKRKQTFLWHSWLTPARTFPMLLPAWLIMLESALGCKQGTLFKAPRGSDLPTADRNVFAKSDYWNLLATRPTSPLQVSNLTKTLYLYIWCISFVLQVPSLGFKYTKFGANISNGFKLQATMWHQSQGPSSPMNKGVHWRIHGTNILFYCCFLVSLLSSKAFYFLFWVCGLGLCWVWYMK